MSIASLNLDEADAEYVADCKKVFGILCSKPDRLFHIPFLGVEPAILPQEAISLLVQPTVAVSAAHDRVVALLAQVCNLNYAPQVPAIALILLQQSGWNEVQTYVVLRRLIESSREKTQQLLESSESDGATFTALHAPLFILSRGMEAASVRAVRTIIKGVFPALSTHLESLPPPPGVTLPLSGEASSLSHVSSSLAFKQVVSSFLCGIGSGFLPPQDAARMAEDCIASTPLVLVTHLLALLSLASESLLKCENMEQADRTLRLFASSTGRSPEELGLESCYDSAALLHETKMMEEKILPSALPLLLRRYLQRQPNSPMSASDTAWHNAGERLDPSVLQSSQASAESPAQQRSYAYTSRILSLAYRNEMYQIPHSAVEQSNDPKGLLLRPVSSSPIFSSLLSLLPPQAHRLDWKRSYQYDAAVSTPDTILPNLSSCLKKHCEAVTDAPLCIFFQVRMRGDSNSQDSYQSRPVFGIFSNTSRLLPDTDFHSESYASPTKPEVSTGLDNLLTQSAKGWATHAATSSCALFQLHPDVQPLHWTSPTGGSGQQVSLPVVGQHSRFHPEKFLAIHRQSGTSDLLAIAVGGVHAHVPCGCIGCGSHFVLHAASGSNCRFLHGEPKDSIVNREDSSCPFNLTTQDVQKLDSVSAYASAPLLLDLGIGNAAGHAEKKASLANIPLDILGIDVYTLV